MSQLQQRQQQPQSTEQFTKCKNDPCTVMITFRRTTKQDGTQGWLVLEKDILGQLIQHKCKFFKPSISNKKPKQQEEKKQQQVSEVVEEVSMDSKKEQSNPGSGVPDGAKGGIADRLSLIEQKLDKLLQIHSELAGEKNTS